MNKAKNQFEEIQMHDAQDRGATATRRYLDELQAAQTSEALAEAMLVSMQGMLITIGVDAITTSKLMKGIRSYGTACQLAMMERNCQQPEIFGEALPISEQELITSIYGK